MELVGANEKAITRGGEILPEYHNYFIGNDKKKWKGKVPIYNVVNYTSIYNGIDLKVYSQDIFLKYDFIVSEGANPDDIKLYYPDGIISNGFVEDNLEGLDNSVVQFERTGFVRLEGDKAFFLHR